MTSFFKRLCGYAARRVALDLIPSVFSRSPDRLVDGIANDVFTASQYEGYREVLHAIAEHPSSPLLVPDHLFVAYKRLVRARGVRGVAVQSYGSRAAPLPGVVLVERALIANLFESHLVEALDEFDTVWSNSDYVLLAKAENRGRTEPRSDEKPDINLIKSVFSRLSEISNAGGIYHHTSGLSFKVRVATPDAWIVDEVYESYLPLIEGIDFLGAKIVDLGGQIGSFSALMSSRVGSNGRIITLEPDRENLDLLEENLRLNDIENVTAIQKAVWSRSGTAKLRRRKNETGGYRVTDRLLETSDTVETTSLEDIVQLAGGQIDLLKMDIEGAEHEVLKSSLVTLSTAVRLIVGETHTTHQGTAIDVIDRLSVAGFDIQSLGTGDFVTFFARNRQYSS